MADVFLSYSQHDRRRAEKVADALRASGLELWWDAELYAGARFRAEIATQLHSAKCVVVLWSAASIKSDFVLDEADDGKLRGILVQAVIDAVQPPHGFRQIHCANLVSWKDQPNDEPFQSLLTGIRRTVSRASAAIQAPVAPNPGFLTTVAAAAGRRWFAGPLHTEWKVVPDGLDVEVTNTTQDVMDQVRVIVNGLTWRNPGLAMFIDPRMGIGLPLALTGARQLFSGRPEAYSFTRGSPGETAVRIEGLGLPSLDKRNVALAERGRWRVELKVTWKGGNSLQKLDFEWTGKGIPAPSRSDNDE